MNDDANQGRSESDSYRGYDTPGEDKIVSNTSDALASPSVTSRQRMEAPDAYIGARVNEKPGDSNPALDETKAFEQGQSSTADLLRARETAEEQIPRGMNREIYADQIVDADAAVQGNYGRMGDAAQQADTGEAVYENREFGRPAEPSEMDMLGVPTSNLPPEESDGR